MATVPRDPNGYARLILTGPDGNRLPAIYLGKMTQAQADTLKVWANELEAAKRYGVAVSGEALAWLNKLDDAAHAKLAKGGLVQPRSRSRATLGMLMAEVFTALTVKGGTKTTYSQTRQSLKTHFGEGRPLAEIGPLEAEKWRQWMQAQRLADATISKRVKTARQFFRMGVRWKMLAENPLTDVKAGSQTNKERMFFVTRDMAEKVLDECPDAQWRLLFALSRYGGLRCPSEHLALKWGDIDWSRGRSASRHARRNITREAANGGCRSSRNSGRTCWTYSSRPRRERSA